MMFSYPTPLELRRRAIVETRKPLAGGLSACGAYGYAATHPSYYATRGKADFFQTALYHIKRTIRSG
jgi:hypothetical protein